MTESVVSLLKEQVSCIPLHVIPSAFYVEGRDQCHVNCFTDRSLNDLHEMRSMNACFFSSSFA